MKTLDEYLQDEIDFAGICVDCVEKDGDVILCCEHVEMVLDALLSLRRELLQ